MAVIHIANKSLHEKRNDRSSNKNESCAYKFIYFFND